MKLISVKKLNALSTVLAAIILLSTIISCVLLAKYIGVILLIGLTVFVYGSLIIFVII